MKAAPPNHCICACGKDRDLYSENTLTGELIFFGFSTRKTAFRFRDSMEQPATGEAWAVDDRPLLPTLRGIGAGVVVAYDAPCHETPAVNAAPVEEVVRAIEANELVEYREYQTTHAKR
jgi:hypothetical protein